MKKLPIVVICGIAFCVATVKADQSGASPIATAPVSPPDPNSGADTRHGWFNLLDSRSTYGSGAFPEPFLVDDSDLEVNENRLDWLHTRGDGPTTTDIGTAEIEKGFGPLTLEIEVPYERDSDPSGFTQGFANIDLGARTAVYQYVSQSGFFDTTFGVAVEVGIPTTSPVSKNTELVPKVFNDTKIGNFTMQSIFGFSMLYGPKPDGGLNTFEYGFDFGYTIEHHDLPIPGVQSIIPIFEMSGETELNQDNPGHNSLLGNAAIRVNTDAIGRVQPRIGLGFVFPMNNGAREDVHWGIYTSLVFEY